MEACATNKTNAVLQAEPMDVPYVAGDGFSYSIWALSEQDLENVNKTACIVLACSSEEHFPVAVSAPGPVELMPLTGLADKVPVGAMCDGCPVLMESGDVAVCAALSEPVPLKSKICGINDRN